MKQMSLMVSSKNEWGTQGHAGLVHFAMQGLTVRNHCWGLWISLPADAQMQLQSTSSTTPVLF